MKKYLKLKCPHYFFFLFASLGDTTKKRENIDPVNYSQSFFFILFSRSLFLSLSCKHIHMVCDNVTDYLPRDTYVHNFRR